MNTITIAVDAMGGDHGPSVIVPAALQALTDNEALTLLLVGDEAVLHKMLKRYQKKYKSAALRCVIKHATQQVEMDESPAQALRSKKDSSMRVAINLIKAGKASACVSAGNTGALMATARFVLKTIPGIDRPAIIASFPTVPGLKCVRMLDLGANVDSRAEHLFQFAVMGSVLACAVDNIEQPKVCLLNIGSEDIKGNEQVKETASLLSTSNIINYSGFIEGDAIYLGDADVVVCDGFVGNVALKTTEGVSKFIVTLLKRYFSKNAFSKIAGLVALPVLTALKKHIDPDRYNGASFIGLQGIVIKSHGSAKKAAFTFAIKEAVKQVEKNIPQRIGQMVETLLQKAENNSQPGSGAS